MSSQTGTLLSDEGRAVFIVTLVFSVIAGLAVALRFWARSMKMSKPHAEDWVVLCALVRVARIFTAEARLTSLTDLYLG